MRDTVSRLKRKDWLEMPPKTVGGDYPRRAPRK